MNEFGLKTKIYFGENALDRLIDIPYERIIVITDPFVVKSGMIRLITYRLFVSDKHFEIYSDVIPDPPLDEIVKGVQKLIDYQPDVIIAVGGGAALDSAKAMKDFAYRIGKCPDIPIIAIPTTSGTGSEVTSFAVVTDTASQTKIPLISDRLTPDEAILDAELVKSVPDFITADTGMDVLTHALEAYVSVNSNEFSDALAEKTIALCGSYLVRAYRDGNDMEARNKMHAASCMAGIAFSSVNLGLNHGMAHQLGGSFHIAHGRANAILLPHIIEYNSNINKFSYSDANITAAAKKYANAAKLLGISCYNEVSTVRALVNWLQIVNNDMNIPLTVEGTGKTTEAEYMARVDAMAEAAIADRCTAANPRKPEKEEVAEIFRSIWK